MYTTRHAVIQWIKEHPEDALLLINNQEYRDQLLPETLKPEGTIKIDEFIKTLENNLAICSQCYTNCWRAISNQLKQQCEIQDQSTNNLMRLIEKLKNREGE